MARKALVEKAKEDHKYETRDYNRCSICGRSRGYMRDFGICRLCFRKLAHKGELPGVKKASW